MINVILILLVAGGKDKVFRTRMLLARSLLDILVRVM